MRAGRRLIAAVLRIVAIQFYAELELAVLYLISAVVLIVPPTACSGGLDGDPRLPPVLPRSYSWRGRAVVIVLLAAAKFFEIYQVLSLPTAWCSRCRARLICCSSNRCFPSAFAFSAPAPTCRLLYGDLASSRGARHRRRRDRTVISAAIFGFVACAIPHFSSAFDSGAIGDLELATNSFRVTSEPRSAWPTRKCPCLAELSASAAWLVQRSSLLLYYGWSFLSRP